MTTDMVFYKNVTEFNRINSDSRGEINTLTNLYKFPEATMFRTRAGFARGGCIHRESREYLCVIEGAIDYYYLEDDKTIKVTLHTGQTFITPPSIPHYFVSITDSTVIEWGPKLSEKQERHEGFRKIVTDINIQTEQDYKHAAV